MQFAKVVWDTSKAIDRKYRASNRTHISHRGRKDKNVFGSLSVLLSHCGKDIPLVPRIIPCFWESAWSDKVPPAQHRLQGLTPQ